MGPKLDPAILTALSLDAATTSIASHGGSGFASTFKLTSTGSDGEERHFFVKQGKGRDSEVMFAGKTFIVFREISNNLSKRHGPILLRHSHILYLLTRTGEHMSLNAIHSTVPTLCPKSYANGKLSDNTGAFLATDFLDLSSRSSVPGSGLSLAQKLAKLHSTPAPIPEGYGKSIFGFPIPTCCGDTQQDNSFKASWAEFYGENRLKGILRSSEKNNGRDGELEKLVEKTVQVVVPRLLADGHLKGSGGGAIVPVVVHGDLWSGNHGQGTIGKGCVEEVVFDPSSCYAHAEYERGIMTMFGGFDGKFEKEYLALKAKDEPVEEWEDRNKLYEL